MFKSGIGMMAIIMSSRVLGLFRSVAMAYYFGAGEMTDAYYSAFKISNFFRQLLGEGALGNSFIPLYNDKLVEHGEEESKKFIFSVLNFIFLFSVLVTILTIVFSKQIINYTVMGFPEETKNLASFLLKIMSSYFIFISLSGMISAVLNNFKQFLIPASTGIFFNLAIIASTIIGGKTHGITILGYGVVVAGLLQFLVVLPAFFKIVKGYSFKIDFSDPYVKKIFLMMGPMLIGIAAKQINTVVDQYFASYLPSGGVTALENATRIYTLPIGVFGVSLSTIIFPVMANAISNNRKDILEDKFMQGLNILLFLVVPSMAVFTVFSEDVIRLTLSYGKFSEDAVKITSGALFYYSLGLYFYTAIHLLTRGFYGMKDSKNPVKFSVISIFVNIALNALLIKPLQYKGLALASSIASGVNFCFLLYTYHKTYVPLHWKRFNKFLIQVLISTALATGVAFFIHNTILKLVVFSITYLLYWAYPIYRKKMDIF